MFGQDLGNEPIRELMQLFTTGAQRPRTIYLLDRFHGNFVDLVEAAGSSYELLRRLLVEMPYFKDVELYDKLEVPFYKRPQLTVADVLVAFEEKGPGRFDDLYRLTSFADNLYRMSYASTGFCSTTNGRPHRRGRVDPAGFCRGSRDSGVRRPPGGAVGQRATRIGARRYDDRVRLPSLEPGPAAFP
jgi:hypothetical protein